MNKLTLLENKQCRYIY